MFYVIAFVIGGCARSAARAALFGVVYVALYAAFLFANSAQALGRGTTSIGYVLQYFAVYAAIACVVTGVGYLCRISIGERLARSADSRGVTTTFD